MTTTTAAFTEEGTRKILQTPSGPVKINDCGPANGRPVLFMHGVGPGATSWSNFAPDVQILGKKYRCLLVDAPGFSLSYQVRESKEARNTINARAFKEVLDVLGIQKATVIGNSMGGGAGFTFAIDYPDRIDKLVTMGSGAGGGVFSHQPSEGIKILQETYRNPTPENFRRLVQVMVYDSSFVTDALVQQRSQGALAVKHHLDNYNNQKLGQRNIESELGKIKAKTLLTHGRNDRTVGLEGTLNALNRIPGAQCHIYNECAHWVQLEKVDEWTRLVMDFLDH